jgi:23S rRNA A1618 N6-methylase RlmF
MENNAELCTHGYLKEFGCLLCNPELKGTGKTWTTTRIYQGQTLRELHEEITRVMLSNTFSDSEVPWGILMENKELRLPLEAK